MENALVFIDKYLGWLYRNMFKVLIDSGDFIQGIKVLLKKEMDSVIKSIFDFGTLVCLGFIALDSVLIFMEKDVTAIPIYSKIISLCFILAFKYKLTKYIKTFGFRNMDKESK